MGFFASLKLYYTMSTFFFKDFGKNAKDIITKDRPLNKQIQVTDNLTPDYQLVLTAKTRGDEVVADAEFTADVPKIGGDVSVSVDSDAGAEFDITICDKLAKGLKLALNVGSSDVVALENQSVSASVEYKYQDKAAVTGKIDFPSGSSTKVDLSAAVFKNSWAFGLSSSCAIQQEFAVACDKVSGGVQYNHPEYFVTALAHRSGAKDVSSEVRYYRKSGDLQIGTEFLYNYTTAATAATVGVAKSCENGVVKAVVGTSGVVGLSWKKRLDANTEVIVGCNADVQRKEYQVGFNLNVTA